MLKALRKSRGDKALGTALCAAIGARAREPLFFARLGVPDTIDGRFDILVLHAWMVLERLREQNMKEVSQALVDELFVSFDESLRELGVGDIGIGHRVKKMADAFYGRLSAYGAAKDDGALQEALARNVYRGEGGHETQIAGMARYVISARQSMASGDINHLDFGPLP